MRTGLALAVVVAATPRWAGADDFSARARAGYNQVRGDEQESDTFAQVYDLRYERPVSPVILYRLALRAQDNLGTALVDDEQRDYENRELRPLLLLQWERPSLSLQLGYDLTWSQTLTDRVAAPSRLLQHATASVVGRPSDEVRLGTDVQWRLERGGDDLDRSEVRGTATAAWATKTVTLSAGPRVVHYQDRPHDFSRLAVGVLSTSSWSDTFDGGKVSATLANTAQWNVERQTSRAAHAADQIRRELPITAFHAVDLTPLESRDVPLVAVPALLDGDLATATAIDLGPTGADDQTLGVDMGRFVAVDEMRIDVRTATGNTVPRGGDVLFDVYTSVDGVEWQLHQGGASAIFVVATSSYVVDFPNVSARFLKVVTFGVNSLETRVTELEVFSHSAFMASEDRTSHSGIDSVQVAFSYSPLTRLRLAYTGLFNVSLVRGDGDRDVTGIDWAQTCSLTVQVARWLEALASAEDRRFTQSGHVVGAWSVLTAQLTARPTATISTSARASRGLTADESGTSHNDEARLSAAVRLLPGLDSSLELGYGRQVWEAPLDRHLDRTLFGWTGNAQLLRSLRLSGNVSMQRAHDGEDDPLAVTNNRAYGEVSWHASRQLLVVARLGWAEGDVGSGVIQRYRIDWHPFPGGALNLGFSYDDDQQSTTGYRSRRVTFFPSWVVNPHTVLDLNYTRTELDGPQGTRRNELLFVVLTLNT